MAEASDRGWLLLIHQIPPKPPYLRAKIGRRLAQVGAVPVKNSVYVLPAGPSTLEDFQWITREILKGGGEATICDARFVDGLSDLALRRMFNDARDKDYRALVQAAAACRRQPESARDAELARLRQRLADLTGIDFFQSPAKALAEAALRRLDRKDSRKPRVESGPLRLADYRGRTWVTRKGIHVDRIASAWLIRRFIDPKARFKFVPGKSYEPGPKELRFDMFEGEFTHEGENCSFETLLDRFRLADPPLRAIAEIVHDIDLKDRKFRREEAIGLDRLIAGICMAHDQDDIRLSRGSAMLDDLAEYFRKKRG
jgi:hypothetical protein